MKKGYWIARIDVTDPEHFPEYMAASSASVAAFGGRFLVRGGEARVVEGASRSRNVIIEFASYAQAQDCYASAQYQQAVALRQKYAQSDIVIVEGS